MCHANAVAPEETEEQVETQGLRYSMLKSDLSFNFTRKWFVRC